MNDETKNDNGEEFNRDDFYFWLGQDAEQLTVESLDDIGFQQKLDTRSN